MTPQTKTVGIAFVIEREKYTEALRDLGYALGARALIRASSGIRSGSYSFGEDILLPENPTFYAYYEYEDPSDPAA